MKYNSVSNIGTDIVNLLGPVTGLILVGVIGVQGALLFNAFTFAVCALIECFLIQIPEAQIKTDN